jgi:hypothetical protein
VYPARAHVARYRAYTNDKKHEGFVCSGAKAPYIHADKQKRMNNLDPFFDNFLSTMDKVIPSS